MPRNLAERSSRIDVEVMIPVLGIFIWCDWPHLTISWQALCMLSPVFFGKIIVCLFVCLCAISNTFSDLHRLEKGTSHTHCQRITYLHYLREQASILRARRGLNVRCIRYVGLLWSALLNYIPTRI